MPAGTYKLEVWGAQGGDTYYGSATLKTGAYGGYSVGTIKLDTNTTLYVVVGGKGETSTSINPGSDTSSTRNDGGYNGGGRGYGVGAGGRWCDSYCYKNGNT